MATITKKELVDRIADDLNLNRPRSQIKRVQVKRVVQKFLDMIIEELSKGNRLEFREFGVFESKLRAARLAQNPKTLERVTVPSKRSVKFKIGRLMKEKMTRYGLQEAPGGNHQPQDAGSQSVASEQSSVGQ
ncbi:MAG: HU family DNA-binding protein [Phycisphaerae bacterium]